LSAIDGAICGCFYQFARFCNFMRLLSDFLAAIGRRGTEGFALSIFMGLALPQLASHARPLLPISIFCFTTVVFMRADYGVIRQLFAHPAKLIAGSLWLVVAPALLIGGALAFIGRENLDPGLVLGLAILGAAPPIMSSPAVAIIYGFEPSLIIACVLVITTLSPLVAPFLVDLLAGAAVPLDRSVLALRLLLFIGGGMVAAGLIRAWLGKTKISGMKAQLDGFGVVMYFVFAIAAMDGVTSAAMANPQRVAFFLAIAFAISTVGIIAASLVLRFAKPTDRFMLGYGTGQRNMGLLVAALGAGVTPTTYLFFALAQFPIYLLPWLLKPVAKRLAARQGG
jgi:bile acid:Na+ symporter, BASS family